MKLTEIITCTEAQPMEGKPTWNVSARTESGEVRTWSRLLQWNKPELHHLQQEEDRLRRITPTPPDPDQQNSDRASWAEAALDAFCAAAGTDPEYSFSDLLGDLAHYCDRNGLDLGREIKRASVHYNEETGYGGVQFDAVLVGEPDDSAAGFADPLVRQLVEALSKSKDHLEYCGYGDRWERECARDSKLAEKIEAALVAARGLPDAREPSPE